LIAKRYHDINDYIKLIAILRGEDGCPWDRVQTHESIRQNCLEEAYEVCEAIDEKDPSTSRRSWATF
jgi:tetrapyrrole methylase family protein/MazG family protein